MPRIPGATYRVQLHARFNFDDAAGIADYLAGLGISHFYASPYLQAVPGSTHGYDVLDPNRVNEELGGETGHERFCQALRENGLGQVLDVVPNHMAISGTENRWWWDVLENGPASRYAAYFDVDWDPPEARLSNKILLPILGDHYGRVLESDEILVIREGGRFMIQYHEHKLPVAPRSLIDLLEKAAERAECDELAFIADALRDLPLPTATDRKSVRRRHRDKEVIRSQIEKLLKERPKVAASVDAAIGEYNADPNLLDSLLEGQNYRLAFWRTAERDLGYRRFFDINSLIGLRIEDEEVFADTHKLILGWLEQELLDGLRIDHPDGLRDPEEYLRRLRLAAPEAWIVVEKILQPDERLPISWPVNGTTGYDFLNRVGGLFVDPAGEKPLTDFYSEFTGEPADYDSLMRAKKHQVMNELFGSEINRLSELVMRICERHRRHRDYTRFEVQEGLKAVISFFPVYRTYIRAEAGKARNEDRKIITDAIQAAKERRPDLDPHLFEFLQDILLLRERGEPETELVMRFQQVTGPITAKGIEDTAFYCFNRLIALNEVGEDPGDFGLSVASFHEIMRESSEHHPLSMLATSTHDTKRSEDVRARIFLLSEIPDHWAEAVRRWSANNDKYRREPFPDRNFEYMLYQNLVGAWPIETERVLGFAEKAMREAKVHTSWTRPNQAYEEVVKEYVERILEDPGFQSDLEAFVHALVGPGRINSLSQTLIKLTAPGIPDIYQGTEIWNLSLVDPDNRRPVDYSLRRRLLAELDGKSPEEIMSRMEEGLPKLWVIRRALELRAERLNIFADTNYQPLEIRGDKADHAVAFLRGEGIAVLAPRLVWRLSGNWGETEIGLPEGRWRNRLTGDLHQGGEPLVREILNRFPVALLVKEG